MNINERGTFFTVQKAVPLMGEGGSIIVMSSILNIKAGVGYGVYSATKAALRSFVRTWTMELRDRGIRVNTLSPGPIDTPIMETQVETAAQADELRKGYASMIPLGGVGKPEELGAAALFLASSESSFVAGIDLCVDGGTTQV